MLTDDDKEWLSQLFDRFADELKQHLSETKRRGERREVLVRGNIPQALHDLSLNIDALFERIERLEKRDPRKNGGQSS